MSRSPVKIRAKPIKFVARRKKFFGFALLAAAMVLSLTYQAWMVGWLSDDLKVWIFDVGQADAIFIEMPEGKQILVDVGGDGAILAKLGQIMLPWDRTIDAVVITHSHADHEGGLPEVLRRYSVGTIYKSGALGSSDLQESVHTLAEEQGTEIVLVSENPSFLPHLSILSPDSFLSNKKPDNLNSASVVLLLTYGQTSILLTGDAPIDEEDEILDDLSEPIDILKVAHHGSITSTSSDFLEATAPRYAVISVGEDNDYDHPHPAMLERLRLRGIQIFRTDLDGDILITSGGGEPAVESRPLSF